MFADLNQSPSEKMTDHKMISKKVLWVNTLKFLEWSKSGKDCSVSHKTSASKHWPGLLCPVNALHSFQHVARRLYALTQPCWSEWSIPCMSVCLVLWVGKFCFVSLRDLQWEQQHLLVWVRFLVYNTQCKSGWCVPSAKNTKKYNSWEFLSPSEEQSLNALGKLIITKNSVFWIFNFNIKYVVLFIYLFLHSAFKRFWVSKIFL